ncbi:Pes1 protein [Candida orthopsilosis Co 90-125]|uniref:Pescadillo homolog n=1 Tax=Candida orthopsilosis (strain 90-125) TaxID=1136231 RepID=H8X348_CANO9|nr:Pes1 protein [Candida orthopsilosis Co 90-125]CCG25908.1 Pes1 protein [Candida orthopsilosis Co 90-125]
MARIKRKGTSGNAKNFITRTQAIKKLQISLADFRRLCIFKGIYPREPRNKKKANKGSTAPVTFYYTKDIQYLLHEPVLDKFRQHKTFAKKLQRALGKGEISSASKLEQNRPKYKLNHIIKERYPTFLDALRDLDDPLNMLFLFSNMPATDRVSTKVVGDAERLCNQWLAYIAKERLLKKVFVSIKGVYYQATVKGQEIRWLIPYKFPTNIPTDVDFRIMLTFLEFYSTLLNFVMYKLYNESELIYPPQIDMSKLKGVGGLTSYVLQSKDARNSSLLLKQQTTDESNEVGKELSQSEIQKAMKADQETGNDGDEESKDAEEEAASNANVEEIELDTFQDNSTTKSADTLIQPSKFSSPTSQLFSKFIFYIGREVPLDILEFVILSCGGSVISEISLDDLKINDPKAYNQLNLDSITHQICDRNKVLSKVPGRTYIQPQWVFDCVNKQELISVGPYAPGETLPPHLSPWGDAGGYDPNSEANAKAQQAGEGEENVEESEEEEIEVESGDEDQEEEEEEEEEGDEADEDEDLKAQKELEMEVAGEKFSDLKQDEPKLKKQKTKSTASSTEDDEAKELAKIMMTNKQKKLYKKMQYGIEKKETRNKELTKKRKQLEKKKKQLQNM